MVVLSLFSVGFLSPVPDVLYTQTQGRAIRGGDTTSPMVQSLLLLKYLVVF